tara:strand:+ start:59 stop:664 length:606 start_codon:yes stop_codon:yes gene_type:complete
LINFINIEESKPYEIFKNFFLKALDLKQKNPDAICISTYDNEKKEINSRFVNLKYINENKWFFFTNYNSSKAKDIEKNNQISVVIFWSEISTQVRLKANIYEASAEESNLHFEKRSLEKNALAISSNQSNKIKSYDLVKEKYERTMSILENKDIFERPDYWGGYFFIPYYFEFWEGHKNRLNKRTAFEDDHGKWEKFYLEP